MQYTHAHNKVKLVLFIVALICIKASYKLFNFKIINYTLDKLLLSFRRRGAFAPNAPSWICPCNTVECTFYVVLHVLIIVQALIHMLSVLVNNNVYTLKQITA